MDYKLFWWTLGRRCIAMFGSRESAERYVTKHYLRGPRFDAGLLQRRERRVEGRPVSEWTPVEL